VHEPDAVEVIGDGEGENQADRRADQEIEHRVAEHLPEHGVGPEALEIGQADEGRLGHQVPVRRRDVEGLERRVEADQRVEQDRHGQEGPGPDDLLLAQRQAAPEAAARAAIVD
jgi:hypothetical protein